MMPNIILVLFVYYTQVVWSDQRFVDYGIISSVSSSPGRTSCAAMYAGNEYMAARVNDVTGICEGLKREWGNDPQYASGYTYLRKIGTSEIYQPSVQISTTFQWLIPGTFGVGGSLDFYFTMPSNNAFDGFEINILNSTEVSYSLHDNEAEALLVHIYLPGQPNTFAIKTWAGGLWSNKLITENPMATGSVYKITVVPLTDVMRILLDGEEVVQFNHVIDPKEAKQISFWPYPNTVLELHNITFVGI